MNKYRREMECVDCGACREVITTSNYRARAACYECDAMRKFEPL